MITHKKISSIFFYDLYLNLKKEKDFELDISNFETFLHVFTSGVWMSKEDTEQLKIKKLRNLCRTLWVQKTIMNSFFDQQFDLSIKHWFDVEEIKKEKVEHTKEKQNEEITNNSDWEKPRSIDSNETKNDDNFKSDEFSKTDKKAEEENLLEFYLEFNQGGSAVSKIPEIRKEDEIPFIFSDEKFFPFKHRRVQQLWKKMKHNVSKVEGDRIDIKSTLDDFIKDKYIAIPRYFLENSGNINFFLFIEQGGPMDAYHKLAENLYTDLRKSDKNNLIHRFFFTNYPIEIENKNRKELAFFKDRNATEVMAMSSIIEKIKDPSCIIFFSDAGALDKTMSNKRINLTINVLESLNKKTSNILWINPVLDLQRWHGTSASYISLFSKMIPYTFKGIERAIEKLRN